MRAFSLCEPDGYVSDESTRARVVSVKINEPGDLEGAFRVDFGDPEADGLSLLRITTREQLVKRIESWRRLGVRPSQSMEALRLVDQALEKRSQHHSPEKDRGPPRLNRADEKLALAADDGELCGHYQADERDFVVFQELHYSAERKEWLARFAYLSPERGEPYADLTYAETRAWGRSLHGRGFKPSQSLIAVRAFEAKLDLEVQRLDFS